MDRLVCLMLLGLAMGGCFSSSRHVATVRTDMVKPSADISKQYRLARLVLKRTAFSEAVAGDANWFEAWMSRSVAATLRKQGFKQADEAFAEFWADGKNREGYLTLTNALENYAAKIRDVCDEAQRATLDEILVRNRRAFEERSDEEKKMCLKSTFRLHHSALVKKNVPKEVKKLAVGEYYQYFHKMRTRRPEMMSENAKIPGGAHARDGKMVFDVVKAALLSRYPSVFNENPSSIPLTVVLDWGVDYKEDEPYAMFFNYWLWPLSYTEETSYKVFVIEGATGKSEDGLWEDYFNAVRKFPNPPSLSSGIRTSETWESAILPLGIIPVIGESDYDRTYCFMRQGKGSLINNAGERLFDKDCMKDIVFDPATDGDVVAAMIMRALNRMSAEGATEP